MALSKSYNSVSSLSISNLTDKIYFNLSTLKNQINQENFVCSYWSTNETKWKQDGMESDRLTTGNIRCATNHFSAFAYLESRKSSNFSEKIERNLWILVLIIFFLILSVI